MEPAVEDIFQTKTPREHVLIRPGTYIGSIEPTEAELYVIENSSAVKKNVKYTPGLIQIIDEILVNAMDAASRDPETTYIKIDMTPEGVISVTNDSGKLGVPVVIHKKENIYVPEMIFGQFLSGSNFNDSVERTVGGTNGIGAKAANVFSKFFNLEIVDSINGKKFVQEYKENMSIISKPVITKSTAKGSYIKITFLPDYPRFGVTSTEVTFEILKRRAYDCSALSGKKVYFNETEIKVKTFERYIDLFIGTRGDTKRIYEILPNGTAKNAKTIPNWELCVALSESETFEQVSFVNGIPTIRGGKHVEYITKKLVTGLSDLIKSKHKDLTLKNSYIKDYLFVFLKATVINPAFSSQTKEELTTNVAKFGFSCELSDEFISKVSKIGIVDKVVNFAQFKETKSLSSTDGKKKSKLLIPKLEDAVNAGTSRSNECVLILTEGDSAKALAMAGREVVGAENYGVFPLRGKLLNVRDATVSQLLNNAEINSLKQILGLEQNKEYRSTSSLRYGRIMLLCDADADAHHIKGLVINWLHHFWPTLVLDCNFITQLRTPIIKVSLGNVSKSFYSEFSYLQWKAVTPDHSRYKIKYYKGLGTSTDKEAIEYFKSMSNNLLSFTIDKSKEPEIAKKETNESILLAFDMAKGRSDERKEWITSFNPKSEKNKELDEKITQMSYPDFIHRELITFSIADVLRSIPCVLDGFKISQRKVFWGTLKKGVYSHKDEIKVAQLAAYIAEHSAYHHGETSLQGTIINMAQDYIGSNNINLFEPKGQFGTRLTGQDSASPRYIFTRLTKSAEILFNEQDSPLLEYLEDDGMPIEPKWYIPIIPMVLVNGASGIGTGFSCNVPCYNPIDIIKALCSLANNKEPEELVPWYRGHTGMILKTDTGYISKGRYTLDYTTCTLTIDELPIGTWKTPYKEHLNSLIMDTKKDSDNSKKYIIDFTEGDSRDLIHYVVKFNRIDLDRARKVGIEKVFKLERSISTNNMHLLDANWTVKKYNSTTDILKEFYNTRLTFYKKRKEYLIKSCTETLTILEAKVKFIRGIIDGEIVVNNRSKDNLKEQLTLKNFPLISGSYKYLTDLPIYSLTKEKVINLEEQFKKESLRLKEIKETPETIMWNRDLDSFDPSVLSINITPVSKLVKKKIVKKAAI